IHLVNQQQKALEHGVMRLSMVSITLLRREQQRVQHTQQASKTAGLATLKNTRSDLVATERSVKLLDPRQVLRRGYSITRFNGKALRSTGEIQKGDTVETFLALGSMTSTVNDLNPSDE